MIKDLSKQMKNSNPDDPAYMDQRQVYQNLMTQKDMAKQQKKIAKA